MPLSANHQEATNLIRRFYAAVDEKDIPAASLGAFISDTFKDHNRPQNVPIDVTDKGGMIGLFAALKAAFSDGKHSLDILEPLANDRAMVYWTFSGTHTGTLFGRPASGNAVSIKGVDIFRVIDGRFTEQWHVEELMALFAQTEITAS